MAGVLNWFSFAIVTTIVRLKSSCYNENAVKITAFWLWAWKKWFLEKGIAKEIENYEPAQLNTLLKRFYAEIKKKTWLNLANNDSISSKVIRRYNKQFLELKAGL